jgi:hypothetical protein
LEIKQQVSHHGTGGARGLSTLYPNSATIPEVSLADHAAATHDRNNTSNGLNSHADLVNLHGLAEGSGGGAGTAYPYLIPPVFVSNPLDDDTTTTTTDMGSHDFYGFTNITNHASASNTSHHHHLNHLNQHLNHLNHFQSPVQSLDALLAFHLPALQSQHLSAAAQQVWSNQTTPELAASIGHGSPSLVAAPASVNPITNAIDQSMVGVSSNGNDSNNNNNGWPDAAGNYPNTTTNASTGVEGGYPSLPPLYDAVGNAAAALNGLASLNGGTTVTGVNGGVGGGGGGSITGASAHPAQTTSDGSLAPIDSHYAIPLLPSLHHHHHTHRLPSPGTTNSPANPDATVGANSNGSSTVTVGPVPSSSSSTNTTNATTTTTSSTQSLATPASASLLNLAAISPPAGSTQGALPRMPIDAQLIRKQVFYYFNRVRKMQYTFAGESTKDVLRDIVVSKKKLNYLLSTYSPFVSHPFLLNSTHYLPCSPITG